MLNFPKIIVLNFSGRVEGSLSLVSPTQVKSSLVSSLHCFYCVDSWFPENSQCLCEWHCLGINKFTTNIFIPVLTIWLCALLSRRCKKAALLYNCSYFYNLSTRWCPEARFLTNPLLMPYHCLNSGWQSKSNFVLNPSCCAVQTCLN